MEENENVISEEKGMLAVQDLNSLAHATNTRQQMFTNITDKKKLFNLESHVDHLLNDCEGEKIRVKEVLIKQFEKPLKEPIIDETTGEIIKDTEYTMSCILIDDKGESYATGSKVFTIQMKKYLTMFGLQASEGFDIVIVKNKTEKGNKSLCFELV